MPALNGYGAENPDIAAETFVTAGLSKVLKINNICDNEHLTDCGLSDTILMLSGNGSINFPKTMSELNTQMVVTGTSPSFTQHIANTKAAAFETVNGESLAVYYNPTCVSSTNSTEASVPMQPMVCANFIYDLNGKKGPNTVGKDIGFLTVFYPSDSVVAAPYVKRENAVHENAWADASNYCTGQDKEYRLPTAEEAAAIFVNKRLQDSDHFLGTGNGSIWTSSLGYTTSGTKAWAQNISNGSRLLASRSGRYSARCVKR